MKFLEQSYQQLPIIASPNQVFADSQPLHDLAWSAPIVGTGYSPSVRFPFANDARSVSYHDQIQTRTENQDYKIAKNRVALVIGEGSLLTSLQYIPEDTIILLDASPGMCKYMETYSSYLHKYDHPMQWEEAILSVTDGRGRNTVNQQKKDCWEQGYDHALDNTSAYQNAQRHARHKAIIPWYANILKSTDIENLADELNIRDATITFMNLTNALQYSGKKSVAEVNEAVRQLQKLPTSEFAPILTTSVYSSSPEFMDHTGPFFGLQNMIESDKGFEGSADAAITSRRYIDFQGDRHQEIFNTAHIGQIGGVAVRSSTSI